MKRARYGLIALSALMALAPIAAQPQSSGNAPITYRPGVGDLMTMTVQPRHLKLGIAGQEGNWTYAGYELHELEESFERIARLWPKWRQVELAATISATTKEPMESVAQAIKEGDAAKFKDAYARLTATCNSCHQSSSVGMVVIQVPMTSSFPNQDFRPTKQ